MLLMCCQSVKILCDLCMRGGSLGGLREVAMMRLLSHVPLLANNKMPRVIGGRGGVKGLGLGMRSRVCFSCIFHSLRIMFVIL